MATSKVTWNFDSAAEYRFIRNELEIWASKIRDHAKTLRPSKEKTALGHRVTQLERFLKEN